MTSEISDRSLGLVAIVVPDYDQAIDWYVNVMGCELIEDTRLSHEKRWVVVSPGRGCRLLLARADGEVQRAAIGNQTGGRVFLFLQTTDFWRDYRAFQSQGVIFEEEPRKEAYGTVAVFRDAFGNRWDLIENT